MIAGTSEQREDFARRLDFALDELRPMTAGATFEAHLARRAAGVLLAMQSELIDENDDDV